MPKVYIASHGEHVEFNRVCSHCQHKWTASFDIGVRSMAQSSEEQAAKEANQLLQVEKEERMKNRDVLCPECSHFSEDAMRRHFRKGYAEAILKQYKRAMWMNFLGVIGFGWLPALILYLAGPRINPLSSATPWLSVIALLIVLGLGGVALYKLIGFLWGLAALSSVRRKLTQFADAQLLELAVECYKGNKNSLDSTSFEEVKWNAWQTKPISCKPAEPVTGQVAS